MDINKNHTTVKTYTYTKRGVTLSFGLDVNDKLAKTDFIEVLKVAQEELQKELN